MPRNRTEARVNITGSAKGFNRATRDAAKAAERLQKRIQRMGDGLQRMGRNLTTHVTLPIVGGLALATKAALDDEKSQAQLRKAIENNTRATAAQVAGVEEWIDSLARASGIMDDELRPQLSILVAATGDVTAAQHLLTLGMDVAAGTGRDLSTVTVALAKAQNGQTAGLSRLGIQTKDASGEALTFEEIQDRLAEKYGGQWKTAAETGAGSIERAKVAVAEMSETLGRVLTPYLEDAADALNNLAVRLGKLSPRMQKIVVYGGLAAAALGPLTSIAGNLVSGFAALLSPAGLTVAAIAALAAAAVYAYIKFEGFREAVDNVVRWLRDKAWPWIKEVAENIQAKFAEVVDWFVRNWPQIQEAIGHVVVAVQAIWRNFGDRILSATRVVWDLLYRIINAALDFIRNAIGIVLALINGDWGKAWNALLGVLRAVWDIIVAVVYAAMGLVWQIIRTALTALRIAWEFAWDGIKRALATVWNGIKSIVSTSIGAVKDSILSTLNTLGLLWAAGWSRLKAFVAGIWHGMGDGFQTVIDNILRTLAWGIKAAIRLLNMAIAAANLIPGVNIPKIGSVDFSPGRPDLRPAQGTLSGSRNVPIFHDGGMFRAPAGQREGLALLRDREVVFTPEQLAALSSSRSGSITINVNVSGTKATAHDIAREVGWAMLTKGR